MECRKLALRISPQQGQGRRGGHNQSRMSLHTANLRRPYLLQFVKSLSAIENTSLALISTLRTMHSRLSR
jgi:hypothetical protein